MIIDEVAKYRANYIHDTLIQHLPGRLLDSQIDFFNTFFIKNPEKDGALIKYRLDVEGRELFLIIHVPDDILLSSVAKMTSWIAERITQI